jgi:hypothetical protein
VKVIKLCTPRFPQYILVRLPFGADRSVPFNFCAFCIGPIFVEVLFLYLGDAASEQLQLRGSGSNLPLVL